MAESSNEKKEFSISTLIYVVALIIVVIMAKEGVLFKPRSMSNNGLSYGHLPQVTEEDKNNLLLLTLCEAGNQPHEGKVAVAATVLNRVKVNEGSTITSVIVAPYQFSCYYNGCFHVAGQVVDLNYFYDDQISDAQSAVEEALNGRDPTKSKLGGALYYYNPDYSSDEANQDRVNISKTQKIGDHVFYREWD